MSSDLTSGRVTLPATLGLCTALTALAFIAAHLTHEGGISSCAPPAGANGSSAQD